jgi:glycosyltransferase involved in cell wall biosynthesis
VRLAGTGRPASARNAGILLTRGEFVAFCDDDDVWYANKLALQLEHFARNADAALVSGRCRWVGADERVWPELDAITPTYANLCRGNFIPCSMTMVRREALDRHGVFDESPALAVGEDWDLWLRIVRHHPFVVLPDIVGDYLVHAGGASRKRLDELRGVLAVLERIAARDPATAPSLVARQRALRRDLASELWQRGRWGQSLAVRAGLRTNL